jgi:hypothetical protein
LRHYLPLNLLWHDLNQHRLIQLAQQPTTAPEIVELAVAKHLGYAQSTATALVETQNEFGNNESRKYLGGLFGRNHHRRYRPLIFLIRGINKLD